MEIPAWPAARPLELTDRHLLETRFSQLQPRVSEMTFAGLYLFRTAHEYTLSCIGQVLVIRGCGYDGATYCLPPLGEEAETASEELLQAGQVLYGLEADALERLAGRDDLDILEDRDSADYLYLRSDLAELPGNRFHKKKNRINYFAARHGYETGVYTPEHRCGCLQLLDEWGRMAEAAGNRSFALEMDATAEGLALADELGLQGVVVLVDGRIRAFALGERLNRETAVCHFEKADHFMEGLSQFVNREFARLLFTDCHYINREQDLGEPGLRNAKLSYHPVELVKKYRVQQNKNQLHL